MNGLKKIITATVLAASTLGPVAALAQAPKIGFVNTERIMRDSSFAQESQKKLESSFSKRQKELEALAAKVRAEAVKLDKDAITLSDAEKVKRKRDLADMDLDFQRKRRDFDEELAKRRGELLGELVEKANKVIRQIAETDNYDIILQEAVFANKRIDITDKVLQQLNQAK